jgi:large conductance mechanosensitive channel
MGKNNKLLKGSKKFFEGFKSFITKGNIIDLAVAVVIGAAFNAIIQSLVNDIILPLFAAIINIDDIANLSLNLNGSLVKYGSFIKAIINFLIISFSIYFTITLIIRRKKFIQSIDKVEVEKPKEVKEDIVLLTEIRDLLIKQNETKVNDSSLEEKL